MAQGRSLIIYLISAFLKYKINNVLIKHSHSSKSLSVVIDENLTCENQVDTIVHYIKENCVG